ncbi:hypothetical protein JAAARDRAFT_195687 [Jaapia argillacea MUCL 33604]|uniref:Uncharacterized protein n=1 Tax=Jaapia argillacea MUCL 33604 TaxID=933084 RepID=A0A067PM10_9AGAM|nr:hypothetical protein JAAARDRAFT_195687 [Jaapia argillacea MUCL 33604]
MDYVKIPTLRKTSRPQQSKIVDCAYFVRLEPPCKKVDLGTTFSTSSMSASIFGAIQYILIRHLLARTGIQLQVEGDLRPLSDWIVSQTQNIPILAFQIFGVYSPVVIQRWAEKLSTLSYIIRFRDLVVSIEVHLHLSSLVQYDFTELLQILDGGAVVATSRHDIPAPLAVLAFVGVATWWCGSMVVDVARAAISAMASVVLVNRRPRVSPALPV